MNSDGNSAGIYRFAKFTFDEATGELSCNGHVVKLRLQVAAVLARLLDGPGELVTREALRDELWHDGRVVSFDMAISTVVRQLRQALGDDSRSPRFVETIPKRGYRFVCPVDRVPRRPPAGRRVEGPRRAAFVRAAGLVFIALASLLLGGTAQPPVSRSSDAGAGPALAILPFGNLTGDAAREPLLASVNEALLGYLGRASGARFRVLGRAPAGPESGSGADYLLEGTLGEEAGGVFRIRLLSAADGGVIWSAAYRGMPERPGLAARAVAARATDDLINKVLAPASGEKRSPKAVAAYRRGREMLDSQDPASVTGAPERFREAIAADPEFAAAYAHLAAALLDWRGAARTPGRIEAARRAALEALERAPEMAVAHRALGEIALFFDRDWPAAGRRLERAAALSPGGAENRHALALWLSARGRHREAIDEIELARTLDPQSLAISLDVMFIHFYARDYEATIRAAERLRRNWPENPGPGRFTVFANLGLGDLETAAREARRAFAERARRGGGPIPDGLENDARAVRAHCSVTADVLESLRDKRPLDPAGIGQFRACAGQRERALALVGEAVDSRSFSYQVPYLGVNPALDPLRGELAFERMLRRLEQAGLSDIAPGARIAAVGG